MNELGMVVDLSLCGEETSRDGIQISRKPPAFTHTSCRALHDHRRAKSDELLRAMAERGGMIGIHPGDDRSSEEHLGHITHAVKVAGIDHVGIASSSGDWSPRSRVSFLTVARVWRSGFTVRKGSRSYSVEIGTATFAKRFSPRAFAPPPQRAATAEPSGAAALHRTRTLGETLSKSPGLVPLRRNPDAAS